MGMPKMKRTQQLRSISNRRHAWLSGRSEEHFARQIQNIGDLPAHVQQALLMLFLPGESLCRILYAPFQGVLKQYNARRHFLTFSLPWEVTPDTILLLTDQRLFVTHLLDLENCEVEAICLDDLLYVRSGVVLLLSWMELCWVREGAVCREVIYFNTVSDKIFNAFSAVIRGHLVGEGALGPGEQEETQALLAGLPYKFMNIIPHRLLLPGEQIRRVLFRPVMFQMLLARLRRVIAPQMALVLTSHHLLLASENISGSEGDYGLVSTFLPLQRIRSAEVFLIEGQAYLEIHLAYRGACEDQFIPFQAEMEFDLRCFAKGLNTRR
jgi:hypothetical protein